MSVLGSGTEADSWRLQTPSLTADYLAWKDEAADPPALIVVAGGTRLSYRLRGLDDLHAWLKRRGDWADLGNADEGKPVKPDTVEAWARAEDNLVGGYYGLRKGYRGRFANYVTPVLEALERVELEHHPRNNRVRAL